jgi:hypothetical protein
MNGLINGFIAFLVYFDDTVAFPLQLDFNFGHNRSMQFYQSQRQQISFRV